MSKNIVPNADDDGTTLGTSLKKWSGAYLANLTDSSNGTLATNKNYVDRKIFEIGNLPEQCIPKIGGYTATSYELPVKTAVNLTNFSLTKDTSSYVHISFNFPIESKTFSLSVDFSFDNPVSEEFWLKEFFVKLTPTVEDITINWNNITFVNGTPPTFGTMGKTLIVFIQIVDKKAIAQVLYNDEEIV